MFSHALLQILWYCLIVTKEKEKIELEEWGQFVEFD